MNNKEMLYIKQNGECYIDKDCKWKNIDECKYWKNRCKEIGAQARKETAEEIISYLVKFEGYANIAGEELAKEYGVEVEE